MLRIIPPTESENSEVGESSIWKHQICLCNETVLFPVIFECKGIVEETNRERELNSSSNFSCCSQLWLQRQCYLTWIYSHLAFPGSRCCGRFSPVLAAATSHIWCLSSVEFIISQCSNQKSRPTWRHLPTKARGRSPRLPLASPRSWVCGCTDRVSASVFLWVSLSLPPHPSLLRSPPSLSLPPSLSFCHLSSADTCVWGHLLEDLGPQLSDPVSHKEPSSGLQWPLLKKGAATAPGIAAWTHIFRGHL